MSLISRISPWIPLVRTAPAPVGGRPLDKSEAYLAGVEFRNRITRLAFMGLVVLPTIVVAIFQTLIASPRYVSEAQFLVRSVTSRHATGLDTLFRTIGISRAADDAYAVQKYIVSRDAVAALAQAVPLREIFGRKGTDVFSRFPRPWQLDNEEYLYQYYLDRVTVVEDDAKGIFTLKVSTFRPEDSELVATQLIKLAEGMVNRLNQRAQKDTIDSAAADVAAAEKRTMEADVALNAFRMRELLVDPGKSSLGYIELIGSLTAELTQASVQLKDVEALSPTSPQIPTIQARIASLEDRIKIERSKLVGTDTSLATKIAEFERLTLLRAISDKALEAAMTSLDTARQEARRQQIYIEEVVRPHKPDDPMEPERFRSIMTVLVFGFAIFSVVWILSVGVGEHQQ